MRGSSIRERDGLAVGAFVAAVVIGGANFVAVKQTVGELDPLYAAAGRFLLAALVFVAIAAVWRIPLPHGAALAGAAVYGALGFGAAYALLYVALVELSVGVASVLMASVPILTVVLAALQRLEPLTARGLLGGALVIAGIGVLSVRSVGGDEPLGYLLAALLAPLVVAQSTIVAKRFPGTHPVSTNAVGMLVGGGLLAVASLATGEAWALPRAGATVAAAVWLVVAGSVGLFWSFLVVVQRWTASASTFVVPLMPLVALALAVGLTGEPLHREELAGAVLVLGGVYVGVLRGDRREQAVAPVDPGGCVGSEFGDRQPVGEAAPVPARSG
jgi:drug/metabolite transporter (DMT)-like permease